MLMLTKVCRQCGEDKTLDEFALHPKGKHGRNPRCRKCKNAQAKVHYENNRDFVLERQRLTARKSRRRVRYGVTPERYDEMVLEQNGLCAFGHVPEGPLVIDHCHVTGRVRGLLCRHCNWAIGLLRDDPERARLAAAYLSAHIGEVA